MLSRQKFNIKHARPTLDTDTRWSSTFLMVKKAYLVRHILNAVTELITKLHDSRISEAE